MKCCEAEVCWSLQVEYRLLKTDGGTVTAAESRPFAAESCLYFLQLTVARSTRGEPLRVVWASHCTGVPSAFITTRATWLP